MTWNLPADLAPWAHHIEATYIALAIGRAAPPPLRHAELAPEVLEAIAAACACAVAARFLAVGKPRSLGILADDSRRAAALWAAHRVWHQPTDVRWAGAVAGDPAVLALGGRAVVPAETLTADIVCVDVERQVGDHEVRRGSHINVLAGHVDDALAGRALCFAERPAQHLVGTLGQLAAGMRDGRVLDELTALQLSGTGGLDLARAAVGLR
jgi:hypothetical protein